MADLPPRLTSRHARANCPRRFTGSRASQRHFCNVAATAVSTWLPLVARSSHDFHFDNPLGGCHNRTISAAPHPRRLCSESARRGPASATSAPAGSPPRKRAPRWLRRRPWRERGMSPKRSPAGSLRQGESNRRRLRPPPPECSSAARRGRACGSRLDQQSAGRPAGGCFARLAEDHRVRRRASPIRPLRQRGPPSSACFECQGLRQSYRVAAGCPRQPRRESGSSCRWSRVDCPRRAEVTAPGLGAGL